MSNSRITFRELFDQVNRELKQARVNNRTSTPDTARVAQKKDVMDWVNQSLNTLSHINPLFWRRAQLASPIVNGNKYEFPLYWKQIENIIVDQVTYLIGNAGDYDCEFYAVSDNEIMARNGYLQGNEVILVGTFRPIKLVYNSDLETDTDMNQPIDIDESWIELLIMMCVNRYAARERENFPQAYALKERLLSRFQHAFPPIVTSAEIGNQVPYGSMGNIRNAY
jgi:hypothetical protein